MFHIVPTASTVLAVEEAQEINLGAILWSVWHERGEKQVVYKNLVIIDTPTRKST